MSLLDLRLVFYCDLRNAERQGIRRTSGIQAQMREWNFDPLSVEILFDSLQQAVLQGKVVLPLPPY